MAGIDLQSEFSTAPDRMPLASAEPVQQRRRRTRAPSCRLLRSGKHPVLGKWLTPDSAPIPGVYQVGYRIKHLNFAPTDYTQRTRQRRPIQLFLRNGRQQNRTRDTVKSLVLSKFVGHLQR